MPQVVVAALTIFGNAVVAVGAIGTAMGFGIGVGALAAGAAVVIGGVMVAKRVMSLFEVEMPTVDTDASRQRTVRSTTEPQKIIYGEALVSGPISFIGLSGTDNSDLYQTIVLAGHEVTDITDIHMDDVVITDSQINGGSDAGGNVTAGTFGPKNSNTICVIKKHLGEAFQTADVLLTGPFANYTSAHRGDGIAYLAMKWVLNEDSAETWDKFAPSNVRALVKGKSVFDPRTDTTVYSDNPALCLADYLTDTILGMGIPTSKIDWDSVTTAANGCDVSVSVPNGTEKRFTCNGVLFATDSHQKNINKILSSMNGNLVYSNGKYIVHAGIFEAATETLNEDDLIGAISIKTSLERSDRFNTIKGLFIDPAQNHKSSEFPKVQLADAVSRDNNEILEKEVQYPMTNSSYMAQRLSHKLIRLSDQQKVVSFPANLSALRITAGDRVQVSVEELNWSNKIFQCAGWTFSEDGGVNLTLREDSSTSYNDPLIAEYSTITATGDITDAFRGVPSPSGLTATPGLKSNDLSWVNPGKTNDFGTIYVYASKNANFSSAIKIGETNGTQFIHDGSNKSLIFSPSAVNVGDTYTIRTLGNTDFTAMGAESNTVGVVFTATSTGSGTGDIWETLSPGDLRYYWVRAVKNIGTDAASQSNLEPNADPNTTVFATVGLVEVDWDNVADPTIGIDINGDVISINLGESTETTGQAVATSGIEAGTTVTQGGITMNQGGSIKGGQSAYNSGTGFFLGYDTNAYKFSIGNSSTEGLTFDGTNLAVTGAITATSGSIANSVTVGGTAASTVVGGAAAGATASQVNAGLALLLNKDTYGNANNGEASLVSVDKDGIPILEDASTTSNGFIQWNGSKITVEAAQYTSSSTVKYTALTQLAGKRGFIVFDTTKSNPFTVNGVAIDVAFAYKEGTQWYYDNNVSATTFTPTNNIVALGYLETGTADTILKGGLINPVTLTAAAFPSDEVKSGSIGGVLITPTTIESNFVTGVSGFQLKSDGTLEAGDGTFRGDITATSLTLSGITIAKTDLDSGVQTSLGSADSAIQDADTSVNLGLNAGSVGGININSASLTSGSHTTYASTDQGFFLGSDGSMSFADGTNQTLTIDTSGNLAITGTVNASAGAFTGDVSTDSKFIAGSGTATTVLDGSSSAPYRIFSGAAVDQSENASFKVLPNGSVFASNITVYNSDGNILLDQNGLGAAALSGISLAGGSLVDKVSGVLYGDTDELILTLDVAATVTVTTKLPIYSNASAFLYFYGSGASAAAALSDITNSTFNVIYNLKTDAGSYAIAATKPISFTGTNSTPSSTQIYVEANYIGGGIQEYRTALMNSGGALEYIANSLGTGADAYVLTSHTFTNLAAGVHKIKLTSTVTGTGSPTAFGQDSSARLYEVTSASVNFVENQTNSFANGSDVSTNNISLTGPGGTRSISWKDSSASNATAFKIYADVTLANSILYIDYDPDGAGAGSWAFLNGGNFLSSGTIYADGAASNSTQWKTGYDYSQIGHLPLAGGTITSGTNTGLLIDHDTFGKGLEINRNNSTNAASITFSNNSGQAGILYATQTDEILRWRPGVTTQDNEIWHSGNLTNNQSNWNTAYTYSQISHLPLAGGTLTGGLSGTTGTFSGAISGASFELSGISVIDASQNINAASISTDGITSAGDITLTSTATSSPSINFNSSTVTEPAVDMAIKVVGEELHFYEPEDTNKVHFKIYDDTGVDAPFGYWVNGTRMADANRNLTVGTISSGTITATGGSSTNWNTAYTYSQVGHLPLTSGTLSNTLTISTTGTNVQPASNNAKFSGFGLIGNRGTLYITNGGGTIQIGNGATHGANPSATFSTSVLSLGSNRVLQMNGTTVISSNRNLINIGTITCVSVTETSDERLKNDIQTLDGSKVLEMRGVSFTKDGKAASGVIAQELEKVASEVVHTADDEMGTKSVAYGNLVGYLIENAKQQQTEIDELKSLVKKLMENKNGYN